MPSRQSDHQLASTSTERGHSPVEVRCLTAAHVDWMQELLERDTTLRIRATGNSMYPFVLSGEWIWLRRSEHTPCIGDIVMILERGHRLLVHRVTRVEERNGSPWIQTRGDASDRNDQWAPLSCVVGRVVRVEAFDASHVRATFRALVLGRLPRNFRSFAGEARRKVGALLRHAPFVLRTS